MSNYIAKKIFLTFKTVTNPALFCLDYLGFLKKEIEYKIHSSPWRIIARSGTPDCREISIVLSGDEYPLKRLPFLNAPIILDLGAHIGCFSLFAWHHFSGKNPKIFSIEPDPENFLYLKKNIERNNLQNKDCYLFNCAIGTTNGNGYLDKSKRNDAYFLSSQPLDQRFVICQVKTLPKLASEMHLSKIDILKMDIEGGEYAILEHQESFQFLVDHVRYLLMEYHDRGEGRNGTAIINSLKNHFDLFHHAMNRILFFKNKSFGNC